MTNWESVCIISSVAPCRSNMSLLFGKRGMNSLWCCVCWCGFLKELPLMRFWTWARSRNVWQVFGAGREGEVWGKAGILTVILGWWGPSFSFPVGAPVWITVWFGFEVLGVQECSRPWWVQSWAFLQQWSEAQGQFRSKPKFCFWRAAIGKGPIGCISQDGLGHVVVTKSPAISMSHKEGSFFTHPTCPEQVSGCSSARWSHSGTQREEQPPFYDTAITT